MRTFCVMAMLVALLVCSVSRADSGPRAVTFQDLKTAPQKWNHQVIIIRGYVTLKYPHGIYFFASQQSAARFDFDEVIFLEVPPRLTSLVREGPTEISGTFDFVDTQPKPVKLPRARFQEDENAAFEVGAGFGRGGAMSRRIRVIKIEPQ